MSTAKLQNLYSSDLLAAVILFIFALGLRLLRLFDLDVWFDEVVLLLQLDKSFPEIWNFCKLDNFPPLLPWLLKIWHFFFPGEYSLRFFTALLGSLTPAAAYFLGKELQDRKFGWILGIACAVSVSLIYFSQMIRMYTIFPFFAVLSVIGFIRGIKTNSWKYWLLTSLANLLGFYTFLFMLFVIIVEALLLIWFYRFDFKKYWRAFIAHLPAFTIMMLWIVPLFQRYSQIQESFLLPPVTEVDVIKLWIAFGTGFDFQDHYFIAFLLNFFLLPGLILGLFYSYRQPQFLIAAAILIVPVIFVYLLSFVGRSIFFSRYFLFSLPLYLALVLAGWFKLRHNLWKKIGLTATFLTLLISMVYYYADYYVVHKVYRFPLASAGSTADRGHPLSQMAALIQKKIDDDAIIIHYSNPNARSFIYFPFLYYHQRKLPEYIYSSKEIPQYYGQQYLLPGEQIKSLREIDPLPPKIWMVSLDSTEYFFDESVLKGLKAPRWVYWENLPRELLAARYRPVASYRFGKAEAVLFRRESKN